MKLRPKEHTSQTDQGPVLADDSNQYVPNGGNRCGTMMKYSGVALYELQRPGFTSVEQMMNPGAVVEGRSTGS